ncbi:acetyl-hydrolase [Luminiphilus syltensis NOR5-1B]|uniref:Acetyl-hydrolase n=1 Tax=Luminiphilus syltensis NOR5-1B TaxID=565045 RepID=B8KYC2_9GAMM|nr:alpha/beta hydrolase [Luminiphilus syltensis]EED36700.1 acetyl-hydrolase [Luminiphilus syltensis NOR5-1B]
MHGALLFLLLFSAAILGWYFFLRGSDHSRFDRGYPTPLAGTTPSSAIDAVNRQVAAISGDAGSITGGTRAKIASLRETMDRFFNRDYLCTIRPSGAGEPRGEWVIPPQCDSRCRLLYIHGGAFIAGSPMSHRNITDRLARQTGMPVFSVDYRLCPEHSRLRGIEDCVEAYQWLVENSPDGPETAMRVSVAGDSAGGNLTLVTGALARDRGLRPVDALIAICATTDATMGSPSLVYNRDSDLMLGTSFGGFMKLPTLVRGTLLVLTGRRSPANPLLSPLLGELKGLPPTLLQVSVDEMLLDDSVRFYHKAVEQGVPAVLETYAGMIHVWHLFNPELDEANIALERIADFLREHDCAPGNGVVSASV